MVVTVDDSMINAVSLSPTLDVFFVKALGVIVGLSALSFEKRLFETIER